MTATWPEVMHGLRGPALAIYDDLLSRGSQRTDSLERIPRAGIALAGVLAWLETHRFVVHRDGVWNANEPRRAQELFETQGPARSNFAAAAHSADREGVGDRRSQGEVAHVERGGGDPSPRPRTHDYQAELFR